MRYEIDVDVNEGTGTLMIWDDGGTIKMLLMDEEERTFIAGLSEGQLEELLRAIALVKSDGKKPNPNMPYYPPGVRGGSLTYTEGTTAKVHKAGGNSGSFHFETGLSPE
jgi:hypothetical protein